MALLGHGCRAEQRVLVVGVAAAGLSADAPGPVWPRPAELVAAGVPYLGRGERMRVGELVGRYSAASSASEQP